MRVSRGHFGPSIFLGIPVLIGAHKEIAIALGEGLGEALGETLLAQLGEATNIAQMPNKNADFLTMGSPPD